MKLGLKISSARLLQVVNSSLASHIPVSSHGTLSCPAYHSLSTAKSSIKSQKRSYSRRNEGVSASSISSNNQTFMNKKPNVTANSANSFPFEPQTCLDPNTSERNRDTLPMGLDTASEQFFENVSQHSHSKSHIPIVKQSPSAELTFSPFPHSRVHSSLHSSTIPHFDQGYTCYSTLCAKHSSLPTGSQSGQLFAGCRDAHRQSHNSLHSNFSSATSWIVKSSPQLFQPYLRLIRFDKPIGTWLLYWPCTWSIALAAQPGTLPDVRLLALFGAGAFFMRGAGCIINDMWDKDFDGKVERTKARPLAAGEVTQFQALVFLGTQLSCSLAILLQLNLYSIVLGASSMVLVVLYPLAKRFTYWPQLVLGLTLNWGVLLAWSALRGAVDLPCLCLYAACILYTTIYDTIYSHQDKYDDLLIGVKSTALRLGEKTKPVLSVFAGAMAAGLVFSGSMCDMTWPYYLGVAVTVGRLAQQIYSVNLDVADECANAFKGNFYLGAAMFIGIVMSNYLKKETEDDLKDTEEGVKVKENGKDEHIFSDVEHVIERRGTDEKDTVMFLSK